MKELIQTIATNGALMAPFILFFTNVVKTTTKIKSEYVPLVSLGVGIVTGAILGYFYTKGLLSLEFAEIIFAGAVGGGASPKVYELGKGTIAKFKGGTTQ